MSTDRNLLYGMLAFANGFITREQLLGAFSAWVTRKTTPLGDLLRECAFLSEEDQRFLDSFVERQIRHHGEAVKSLASLRVDPAARCDLEQLGDPEVQARLATVTAQPPPTASTGEGQPLRGRYRLLRFHAKGGLGEVHLAEDEELRREVALKQIQARFAADPESRRRFVREAEITGGLEHPGIVPVYGLVSDPEGQPCYAMRFIRGESLHDAATRFHQADKPSRDLSERSLALRDLLGRFVAVCNAVAYAHSRRVVHRDLKPANIMLGEFGETVVIDWGLAKLMPLPDGPSEDSTFPPQPGGEPAQTALGKALGTLAFMPPEQARGDHAFVGVESDVFCLGATLYCLLTGRPPYDGPDALERALAGRVTPVRQIKREVPAALEAVCHKAMAPWQAERYPSARTLADDVQRWLADEPVSAYRDPALARAGRWARKNRTLVTTAGAALLVAVVGLGAGLAAVGGLNRKLESANTDLRDTNTKLEAALGEARQQRGIATAVTTFLEDDLLGMADVRNRSASPDPDVTVKELLDRASRAIGGSFSGQPETEAALRRTIGNAYHGLGQYEQAHTHLERSVTMRRTHLGPGHSDALASMNDLALLYHSRGQLDQAGRLFLEVVQRREKQLGPDHRDTLISKNNLAALYKDEGKDPQAKEMYLETLQALSRQGGTDQLLTLATKGNLALLYQDQAQHDLALPLLLEVVREREKRRGPDHYDTLISKNNLASLYRALGQHDQAAKLYREVLSQREKWFPADHPDTLISKHNLASVYIDLKEYPKAESLLVEIVRKRERKLGALHASTLLSKNNLAKLYRDQGEYTKAEALFMEISRQSEKHLGADHPETLRTKGNLAMVYADLNEHDKAVPLLLEVVHRSQQHLGPDHPDTLTRQSNLAGLYEARGLDDKAEPLSRDVTERAIKTFGFGHPDSQFYLGHLLRLYDRRGKPKDAEPLLRRQAAFRAAQQGAESPVTAGALAMLGLSLLQQKKVADAEKPLRDCLRIREKAQPDAWATHNTRSMLGGALLGQNRYAEAEPLLVQGYQGLKQREAKVPPDIRPVRLKEALERLVALYGATGKKDEAAKYRRELDALINAGKGLNKK